MIVSPENPRPILFDKVGPSPQADSRQTVYPNNTMIKHALLPSLLVLLAGAAQATGPKTVTIDRPAFAIAALPATRLATQPRLDMTAGAKADAGVTAMETAQGIAKTAAGLPKASDGQAYQNFSMSFDQTAALSPSIDVVAESTARTSNPPLAAAGSQREPSGRIAPPVAAARETPLAMMSSTWAKARLLASVAAATLIPTAAFASGGGDSNTEYLLMFIIFLLLTGAANSRR